MNRTLLSAAAIVLAIAAASIFALAGDPDPAGTAAGTPAQATPQPAPRETTVEEAVAPPESDERPGEYVEYSPGALEAADGTRLLFFHAKWCSQCRKLEETIEQDGLPAGVTVLKVDYDSSQDLRQKYGVTLQTTVVKVDGEGKLIDRFVPYDDPRIDAVLSALA